MDSYDSQDSWLAPSYPHFQDLLEPQSWTHGLDDARAFLDSHEDMFDDHIDEFCRLGPRPGYHPPSRKALYRLLTGNPETFGRCLWLSLSRLIATPIAPVASAPGRMFARAIRGLLSKPASAVSRSLLARVRSEHATALSTTLTALTQIERDSQQWSVWPCATLCQHALASIDAIMPAWSAAVTRLQNELRTKHEWKGRNHSFRRAARQWSLIAKVLQSVATHRGDLRLLFEYLHCVWQQYYTDPHDGSNGDGSYELLVLEALTFVVQLRDAEAGPLTTVPQPLEQQGPNRRQRIQRARLRLYSAWQPTSEHEWLDSILPTLESLSRDVG